MKKGEKQEAGLKSEKCSEQHGHSSPLLVNTRPQGDIKTYPLHFWASSPWASNPTEILCILFPSWTALVHRNPLLSSGTRFQPWEGEGARDKSWVPPGTTPAVLSLNYLCYLLQLEQGDGGQKEKGNREDKLQEVAQVWLCSGLILELWCARNMPVSLSLKSEPATRMIGAGNRVSLGFTAKGAELRAQETSQLWALNVLHLNIPESYTVVGSGHQLDSFIPL